jgi:hypothetical protein
VEIQLPSFACLCAASYKQAARLSLATQIRLGKINIETAIGVLLCPVSGTVRGKGVAGPFGCWRSFLAISLTQRGKCWCFLKFLSNAGSFFLLYWFCARTIKFMQQNPDRFLKI